jgi:molybdopterin synthase catalytic subunit
MMGSVTIHFFGPAADDAGCGQCEMPLNEPAPLDAFLRRVYERFPRLAARADHLRFAINQKYARQEDTVRPGDEVAVIPPVSGGNVAHAPYVRLEREAISVAAVRASMLGDPALGGIVTFEGTTREETHAEHGALARLEYEAYEEMAFKQMHVLVERARQRWPVGQVAVVHRLGSVAPGEVSVMIAVACPHRAAAFEACRWLIDTLKTEVPIWKREIWADGASTWVDPHADPRA